MQLLVLLIIHGQGIIHTFCCLRLTYLESIRLFEHPNFHFSVERMNWPLLLTTLMFRSSVLFLEMSLSILDNHLGGLYRGILRELKSDSIAICGTLMFVRCT